MDLVVTVPHGTFVLEQHGPCTWIAEDSRMSLVKVEKMWTLKQKCKTGMCTDVVHETWCDRGIGPCLTREPRFDKYGFLMTYLKVEPVTH